MIFKLFNLEHFRNLETVSFEPKPFLNFIYGNNGSGKTSLLEAIYYFSVGRSFRTHLNKTVIQHQHQQFNLFARLLDKEDQEIPLGLERHVNAQLLIKYNHQHLDSVAELAKIMPMQLITTESFSLLTEGPQYRRSFLDRILFYIEPSFFNYWQKYSHALKQRNALLRQTNDREQLCFWDGVLAEIGEFLHQQRQQFLMTFIDLLQEITEKYFPKYNFSFEFLPGWNTDIPLKNLFKQQLSYDLQYGYTTKGPHRFDFKIRANQQYVEQLLSRGQLKLAVFFMYYACYLLLARTKDLKSIFLIDDLTAEFDGANLSLVLNLLSELKTQCFITMIEPAQYHMFDQETIGMFHVEHGQIVS